jgi:hypothetical protein
VIARRGHICVDVVREPDYEQDDSKPIQLGTLRVTACRELTELLTEVASKALKELLPAGWEKDDGSLGIPPYSRCKSLRTIVSPGSRVQLMRKFVSQRVIVYRAPSDSLTRCALAVSTSLSPGRASP